MIVARQKLLGLLMPLGCGVLLLAMGILMPWQVRPFSGWIALLSTWFVLGGVFFAFVGWRCWYPKGIGLMLDQQGIWWKRGGSIGFGKHNDFVLLRWDQIIGVQLVQWTEQGGEVEALIVGLADDHPFAQREVDVVVDGLRRHCKTVPWTHVIGIYDENWTWNPKAVKDHIERSLANQRLSGR